MVIWDYLIGSTLRTLIFSDDLHKLFSTGKRGKVLSLLFQRSCLGESTYARCTLQMGGELRVSFVVLLFTFFVFRFRFRCR